MNREPVICIVGRPNVGKSTVFNRIIRKRLALVENSPGVTRDRHYASAEHCGKPMLLVDTGGFDPKDKSGIMAAVRVQCRVAIEEADLIIHLMDARSGLTPDDVEIADLLRRSEKPVLWAANKVDSHDLEHLVNEFYVLGAERVFPVSGAHGLGVADLLDEVNFEIERTMGPETRTSADIVTDRDQEGAAQADDKGDGCREEHSLDGSAGKVESGGKSPIRVALIGRPNAGKSSLMNRLLGEERSLVHNTPGTTRDPVDVAFSHGGQEFVLVDTAGIRRRKYVTEGMELVAVIHAIKAMERAHVVCLVCDSELGITEQDSKLAALAEDRGRAMVILLNKWDTVKESRKKKELIDEQKRRLRFVSHCPVLRVSALTGKRTGGIPGSIVDVFKQANKRISTSELNRFLDEMVMRRPPAAYQGKHVRLYYMTQPQVNPPTFIVFASHEKGLTKPYRRFLINRLREMFSFKGTAVRLFVRAHRDRPERTKKKGTKRRNTGARSRRK